VCYKLNFIVNFVYPALRLTDVHSFGFLLYVTLWVVLVV